MENNSSTTADVLHIIHGGFLPLAMGTRAAKLKRKTFAAFFRCNFELYRGQSSDSERRMRGLKTYKYPQKLVLVLRSLKRSDHPPLMKYAEMIK
jgi:hypothetical protein